MSPNARCPRAQSESFEFALVVETTRPLAVRERRWRAYRTCAVQVAWTAPYLRHFIVTYLSQGLGRLIVMVMGRVIQFPASASSRNGARARRVFEALQEQEQARLKALHHLALYLGVSVTIVALLQLLALRLQ